MWEKGLTHTANILHSVPFASWQTFAPIIMNYTTVDVYSLGGHVFPFLLSKHIGAELLACMVNVCLLLKEIVKLFCQEAIPLHISTSNLWRFHFLYIFINTCHCWTIQTILVGIRWLSHCDLNLYLMTSDVEHFSCTPRQFTHPPCWNNYSNILPIFYMGYLSSSNWVIILYIFWIHQNIYISLQIFSPNL